METLNTNSVLERYGWITKEEPLSVLNDPNLQLNITILESVAPFFGYYADEPREDKPEYLYWVLDHFYTQEKLIRVIEYVKSNCHDTLDAVPGYIAMNSENYHVIRMKNLKRYNQIHPVQDMFEEQGIKLRKSSRKFENLMGVIYLNKFLHLVPIGKGLYREQENTLRGYFTIPAYLSWDEFKMITREVKYDSSLMFFDAARAAFMENGKITDLVRVYRENLTDDQLLTVQERYLKIITHRHK